ILVEPRTRDVVAHLVLEFSDQAERGASAAEAQTDTIRRFEGVQQRDEIIGRTDGRGRGLERAGYTGLDGLDRAERASCLVALSSDGISEEAARLPHAVAVDKGGILAEREVLNDLLLSPALDVDRAVVDHVLSDRRLAHQLVHANHHLTELRRRGRCARGSLTDPSARRALTIKGDFDAVSADRHGARKRPDD